MVEIYKDIPEEIRKQTEAVANFIFSNFEPEPGLKFIQSYISSCEDEEEKEFVRFYFNMRMEQILNV
jgi:hypothetical protein